VEKAQSIWAFMMKKKLTLRSLTEPVSSMVKPACIKNTNDAALLTD
jgi:hypothetical protein